jgi:hypothetical protein
LDGICISKRMIAVSTVFAVSILLMNYFCPVTAQSLVPGIHGMSIVQGVRFSSVNVTGEKEISFNLKFLGSGRPPSVLIIATALTNGTDYRPDATTTMKGSQILDAGWSSPKSVSM